MPTEKEPFDGGVPPPGSLIRPLGDRAGCVNSGCPAAQECFRYMGGRAERTVVMEFMPGKGKDRCREFLPVYPTYEGKAAKPTKPVRKKPISTDDW